MTEGTISVDAWGRSQALADLRKMACQLRGSRIPLSSLSINAPIAARRGPSSIFTEMESSWHRSHGLSAVSAISPASSSRSKQSTIFAHHAKSHTRLDCLPSRCLSTCTMSQLSLATVASRERFQSDASWTFPAGTAGRPNASCVECGQRRATRSKVTVPNARTISAHMPGRRNRKVSQVPTRRLRWSIPVTIAFGIDRWMLRSCSAIRGLRIARFVVGSATLKSESARVANIGKQVLRQERSFPLFHAQHMAIHRRKRCRRLRYHPLRQVTSRRQLHRLHNNLHRIRR